MPGVRGGFCPQSGAAQSGAAQLWGDGSLPPLYPTASSWQHQPLSAPVTFMYVPQLEDTPAEAVKYGQRKLKSENATVFHSAVFKTPETMALGRWAALQVHTTQAQSVRCSDQHTNPTAILLIPGQN